MSKRARSTLVPPEHLPPRSKRGRGGGNVSAMRPVSSQWLPPQRTNAGDKQKETGSSARESGHSYFEKASAAAQAGDLSKCDKIILEVINGLRFKPQHPRKDLYACLALVSKSFPHLIARDTVYTAIVGLLERESLGSRSNFLSALAGSVLYRAFMVLDDWPVQFVKAYVDDFLKHRSWIENEALSTFVSNIETAFSSTPPAPPPALPPPPSHPTPSFESSGLGDTEDEFEEELMEESGVILSSAVAQPQWIPIQQEPVRPRFPKSAAEVAEVLISRVQPALDSKSSKARQALRLVYKAVALPHIRPLILHALEHFLLHSTLNDLAVELLQQLCRVCDSQDHHTLRTLLRLKVKSKHAGSYQSALQRLFNEKTELWHIAIQDLLIDPSLSATSHPHTFAAVLFNGLSVGLPLALSRVLPSALFDSAQRNRVYSMMHWMLSFSAEHRDFDFVALLREVFSSTVPAGDAAAQEQQLQLLSSFAVFTVMCSTSSLLVSDTASKSAQFQKRLMLWRHRLSVFQSEAVRFSRKAPPGQEAALIRRLLFIDDESVYRLTSGGKATPAESRQYQLVVSMNFLLPQTLEDLLALALIEKRISKLHALEVIELLLERDLSLRYQWMAEATSEYSANARSIVEGILQLCLYSAPSLSATQLSEKLALLDMFWRVVLVLVLLCCSHSSTIGRFAFHKLTLVKLLLEAILALKFNFQQIVYNSPPSEVEVLQRVEKEVGGVDGKLMLLDPGVVRPPPPSLIQQLKRVSVQYQLPQMIVRGGGDLLLDMSESESAEQLGVWLLPAIERDASLALRLPLPILCVLSLLQLSSSLSSTGVLFARLRKALAAGDSDVAVFFLSRLNSPSSASRLVALRALNACISTQQTPTQDLCELYSCLSSALLPAALVDTHLLKALAVETRAELIHAYLERLIISTPPITLATQVYECVLARLHVRVSLLHCTFGLNVCARICLNAVQCLQAQPQLVDDSVHCVLSAGGVRAPSALLDAVVICLSVGCRDAGFVEFESTLCEFASGFRLSSAQCSTVLSGEQSTLLRVALHNAHPQQLLDAVSRISLSSTMMSSVVTQLEQLDCVEDISRLSVEKRRRVLHHLRLYCLGSERLRYTLASTLNAVVDVQVIAPDAADDDDDVGPSSLLSLVDDQTMVETSSSLPPPERLSDTITNGDAGDNPVPCMIASLSSSQRRQLLRDCLIGRNRGVRMCLSLLWQLRHLLLRSSEETRQLLQLILQEMELTNAQHLPPCRTDLLFYIFNHTRSKRNVMSAIDYLRKKSSLYSVALLSSLYLYFPALVSDRFSQQELLSLPQQSSVLDRRLVHVAKQISSSDDQDMLVCLSYRQYALQYPPLVRRKLPLFAMLLEGHTDLSLKDCERLGFIRLFWSVLLAVDTLRPFSSNGRCASALSGSDSGLVRLLRIYTVFFRTNCHPSRALVLKMLKFFCRLVLDVCRNDETVLLALEPDLRKLMHFYPNLPQLDLACQVLLGARALTTEVDIEPVYILMSELYSSKSKSQSDSACASVGELQACPVSSQADSGAVLQWLQQLDSLSVQQPRLMLQHRSSLTQILRSNNSLVLPLAQRLMLRLLQIDGSASLCCSAVTLYMASLSAADSAGTLEAQVRLAPQFHFFSNEQADALLFLLFSLRRSDADAAILAIVRNLSQHLQ